MSAFVYRHAPSLGLLIAISILGLLYWSGRIPLTDLDRIRNKGAQLVMLQGQLTEAHLVGKQFNDIDLYRLANYPTLEVISLRDSSITDAGLTWLLAIAELKRLDLSGTSVGLAGLRTLTEADSLWEISVTHCPNIGIPEIEFLNGFPRISKIQFSSRECPLLDFPRIHQLLGGKKAEYQPELPKGVTYVLMPQSPEGFGVHVSLRDVRHAPRGSAATSDAILMHPDCESIRTVIIDDYQATKAPYRMSIIPRIAPRTRCLLVRDLQVEDLAHLRELSDLERIEFRPSSFRFTDPEPGRADRKLIAALAQWPQIRQLSLVEQPLDAESLSSLLAAPQLTKLEIAIEREELLQAAANLETSPSACTELTLGLKLSAAVTGTNPPVPLPAGLLTRLFPNLRRLDWRDACGSDLTAVQDHTNLEQLSVAVQLGLDLAPLRSLQDLQQLELAFGEVYASNRITAPETKERSFLPVFSWDLAQNSSPLFGSYEGSVTSPLDELLPSWFVNPVHGSATLVRTLSHAEIEQLAQIPDWTTIRLSPSCLRRLSLAEVSQLLEATGCRYVAPAPPASIQVSGFFMSRFDWEQSAWPPTMSGIEFTRGRSP